VGEPSSTVTTEPVSLARRFGALLVDWLLCVMLSYALGYTASNAGGVPVAILVLEYTFFIGLFTQTPGMYVTSLKCVSFTDGGRIGMLRAFLRGVLLALVIPALIMDAARRGLHDKAANSVMVAAPRR
jgi:hypothetical protein